MEVSVTTDAEGFPDRLKVVLVETTFVLLVETVLVVLVDDLVGSPL